MASHARRVLCAPSRAVGVPGHRPPFSPCGATRVTRRLLAAATERRARLVRWLVLRVHTACLRGLDVVACAQLAGGGGGEGGATALPTMRTATVQLTEVLLVSVFDRLLHPHRMIVWFFFFWSRSCFPCHMSDVRAPRRTLQCLICKDHRRFNIGALRHHQLTQHRGATQPHAVSRDAAADGIGVAAGRDERPADARPREGGGSDWSPIDADATPRHPNFAAVDDEIVPLLAATGQPAPSHQQRGLRRQQVPEGSGVELTYPSVATRVRAVYEEYGDASRAKPLARVLKHSKAGRFDSRRLRLMQSFVYKAGGCGLSGEDVVDLWNLFDEWEPKATLKESEPARLRDIFKNAHAFGQALSDDIDEAVEADGWMACNMEEEGEAYELYYREALPVVINALSSSRQVRYWARGPSDEGPSDSRETTFDGDAFRLCEEEVQREHGDGAFVLGMHVFSDSCAISKSGGKCRVLYL